MQPSLDKSVISISCNVALGEPNKSNTYRRRISPKAPICRAADSSVAGCAAITRTVLVPPEPVAAASRGSFAAIAAVSTGAAGATPSSGGTIIDNSQRPRSRKRFDFELDVHAVVPLCAGRSLDARNPVRASATIPAARSAICAVWPGRRHAILVGRMLRRPMGADHDIADNLHRRGVNVEIAASRRPVYLSYQTVSAP
jgi:hypothetical protein